MNIKLWLPEELIPYHQPRNLLNLSRRVTDMENDIRNDYFDGHLSSRQYKDAMREVEELLSLYRN